MPEPNDDLMQQLLRTFRDEADEHLQAINTALLRYERSPDADEQQQMIQTAFRAAHSLKGAARAVSLTDVQTLAHAMETVFQHVRDQQQPLNSVECDRLYEAVDLLKQLLKGETQPVDGLADALHQIVGETAAAASKPGNAPSAGDAGDAPAATDETIRVSLRKLDDLMVEVGEMLVLRIGANARMEAIRSINQQLANWSKAWAELKALLTRHDQAAALEPYLALADSMQTIVEAMTRLEHTTYRDTMRLEIVSNNMQDKVRHIRMIPFSTHRLMLERMVRDVARAEDKLVRFEIVGEHTEMDKKVLELLKDPLTHLLNNAVAHGIEAPDEREALGKAREGLIRIRVQQRGSEIGIQVSDDGRGFDTQRIQAAYEARYGEAPSTDSVVNLAFTHGISTHDGISEIAGRGVGLDVVRVRMASVHGRVAVSTEAGKGSSITLTVPTSLAITRTLLLQAAGETYAIPLLAVEKIVHMDHVISIGGRAAVRLDGRTIPLASLAQVLQMNGSDADQEQSLAVVLSVGDQVLAVAVDDILTEQELAIKPLTYPLKRVRAISGAALLGGGKPVLVLNPADLLRAYRQAAHTAAPAIMVDHESNHRPAVQVLVVDDSITTRTLERNILEAAGYQVITATDGEEALARLSENDIDVVVSDIEMPRMNGFELTRELRNDDRYEHLPIILVTSLERDEDRQQGMSAGANAYIVKRGFDQGELLDMIEQFIS